MLSSVIGEDTSVHLAALLGLTSVQATKALNADCQRTFVDTPLGMVPVLTFEMVATKTVTVTIPITAQEDPMNEKFGINGQDLREAYGRDDHLLDMRMIDPRMAGFGVYAPKEEKYFMKCQPNKPVPLYGDRPDIEETIRAICSADGDDYLQDPFSGIRTRVRTSEDNIFPHLGGSSIGSRNKGTVQMVPWRRIRSHLPKPDLSKLGRKLSDVLMTPRFGFHPIDLHDEAAAASPTTRLMEPLWPRH